MRNTFAKIPARRSASAALFLVTCSLAVVGCSGPTLVSKYQPANREEDLVKSLNEERRRAQYYESQYEQALAKLDQVEQYTAKVASSGAFREESRRQGNPVENGNKSSKSNHLLISSQKTTPKVLNRLVNTLPGLRLGPDKTWAKLDANLLFSGGSQEISPTANDLLTDLAKTLSQDSASDIRVLVVGYSDTQRGGESSEVVEGEDATWQIAAERAVEVVRKLGESGISAERLTAMSRGSQDPVAGNDTAAARAQNRRVEIYLLENDSTWAPDRFKSARLP